MWVLSLKTALHHQRQDHKKPLKNQTVNQALNCHQNSMMKPNNKRFNMTYSNREAPVLVPIEYQLMKELGVDRSSLHKAAIKEMWNRRQKVNTKPY